MAAVNRRQGENVRLRERRHIKRFLGNGGFMYTMIRGTLMVVISACALHAQVTFDRILRADKEPQNWLTYSGSTQSQRYSLLTQITPANVGNLKAQWAFQARSTEKFESTPLVVDGTMYLTQAPNDIVALDAVTGEIKWLYSYSPSREARPCCGRVNRGVAGGVHYFRTHCHRLAANAACAFGS